MISSAKAGDRVQPRHAAPKVTGLTQARGRTLGILIVLAFLAVQSLRYLVHPLAHWTPAAAVLLGAQGGFVLYLLVAALIGRHHVRRRIPSGRVAAIIPAYEEEPEALDACIRSILNQKDVIVDVVHVVDDGSTRHPVRPWAHPRVAWHRKPNGGKRSAQVYALNELADDPPEFVLTVDSDSVLEPHATAQLLRAFSDPRITGASGVIRVSNPDASFITRIADVNISCGSIVGRVSKSLIGSLSTTSGALAMYRTQTLLKHREHYLSAGTFGDDRMLTLYAEMEGQVVGVSEAIANSAMPTTLKDTYRQQLRWAKSPWLMFGFTLTNLPLRHLIFPVLAVMRSAISVVAVAYLVVLLATGARPDIAEMLITLGLVWLSVRYATVALYMLERPDQSLKRRWLTWAFITPIETVYASLVQSVVRYIALVTCRQGGWGTRGAAHPTTPTRNEAQAQARPQAQPQAAT